MSEPLVALRAVSKTFSSSQMFGRAAGVRAVEPIDLEVRSGETLGLVGESGSGKSTIARLMLRLTRPTEGRVYWTERDITDLPERALRPLRRRMQLVFQDPLAALDPHLSIGASIKEAQRAVPEAEREPIEMLLSQVGLRADLARRHPHELSGGQRQRVVIARALSAQPRFLALDEPVSALDVSVQAQVLNLLAELRSSRALSYLFISHDLAVVRWIADRIAVLYLGRIVEVGDAASVGSAPLHPYTRALFEASSLGNNRKVGLPIVGPDISRQGCMYRPRCARAVDGLCDSQAPLLRSADGARAVACHRPEG